MGYGTQAIPIEGCLSIPKRAMALGSPLISLAISQHEDKLDGAFGYGECSYSSMSVANTVPSGISSCITNFALL
jgi:hypothetical protein